MTIETETQTNHTDHADNGTSRLVDGVADASKSAAARGKAARDRVQGAMKQLSSRMGRNPIAFAVAGLAMGYVIARMRSRR